jgi:exonuclease III
MTAPLWIEMDRDHAPWPADMKLLSWNVKHAGDRERVEAIVNAIAPRTPDIVALQEIAPSGESHVRRALESRGFAHVAIHQQQSGSGILIASRWRLELLPSTEVSIPDDERTFTRLRSKGGDGEVIRMLSVLVERERAPFELHNVHVPPGSSTGWRKIDAYRGIYDRLAVRTATPRILCGDFNEPWSEDADGSIKTGAERGNPHARANPARWSMRVRNVLRGLADFDLADVVRSLHGEGASSLWSYEGRGKRRRYDHVFASAALQASSAAYLHDAWPGAGLSDHTALEVTFGAV